MKSTALKMISEYVESKRGYVQIPNYIKEVNSSGRLTEGRSNIIVNTMVKPYLELLRDSLEEVQRNRSSADYQNTVSKVTGVPVDVVKQAVQEVTESLVKSIQKHESGESTERETPNMEYYGNGIYMNTDTNDVYIKGHLVMEKVLIAPTYKPKKSQPKTIAKEYIQKGLPNQLVNYKIPFAQLNQLKVVTPTGING
jgi:hypothetical protein